MSTDSTILQLLGAGSAAATAIAAPLVRKERKRKQCSIG